MSGTDIAIVAVIIISVVVIIGAYVYMGFAW